MQIYTCGNWSKKPHIDARQPLFQKPSTDVNDKSQPLDAYQSKSTYTPLITNRKKTAHFSHES